MRVEFLYILAGLLITVCGLAKAQLVEDDRDKRAVDFGLFVRNLLLKSATASNTKANISRNLANVKTSKAIPRRRPTTTTTTTTTTTSTTPLPFFFNKGPFKFPFDLSGPFNKFNNGGYVNFDYNDYGPRPGRRRTTSTTSTTTSTTTTTTPAAPTRRRPIPRRPYGLLGKQKFPHFDYYNDDYYYDYNYDDEPAINNPTAATAAPPAAAPSPPPPPPVRPQRPPSANRARVQGRIPQLSNRFVYQNRQPDDIFINKAAVRRPQPQPQPQQTATPAPAPAPAAAADNNADYDEDPTQTDDGNPNNSNNNNNNDETSANTNDYTDDNYDDQDVNNNNDANNNNNNNDDNNNGQDYNDSSDNANNNNNNNDDPNLNVNVNLIQHPLAPPIPPQPNNFILNPAQLPYQGPIQGFYNNPQDYGIFAPTAAGLQYQNINNNFSPQYQHPQYQDPQYQNPPLNSGYSADY